jgi:hypothetical protein
MMDTPLVGERYMLPKFYDDIYHKHFGPVMTPLDTFLARLGDYTIASAADSELEARLTPARPTMRPRAPGRGAPGSAANRTRPVCSSLTDLGGWSPQPPLFLRQRLHERAAQVRPDLLCADREAGHEPVDRVASLGARSPVQPARARPRNFAIARAAPARSPAWMRPAACQAGRLMIASPAISAALSEPA